MLIVQQTIIDKTADSALYGRMRQDMLKGSTVYQVGLSDCSQDSVYMQ